MVGQVRVAVIGFPNVGKSALINRLCGKKMCASAARPGVTRQLRSHPHAHFVNGKDPRRGPMVFTRSVAWVLTFSTL